MTPTSEDIGRLKELVQKLEKKHPLEISVTGGTHDPWFLKINNHDAAGNVDFYTVLDMLETVEFLGKIGLLNGKEN